MKTQVLATALACGLFSLLPPDVPAAPIIDKFNDDSAWGKVIGFESHCDLSVANGRLNYIAGTTANGGAAIPRTSPLLPANKDWSLQVDAHINPFKLTKEGQFVDVFLGIGKTGDWEKNHVMFEFDRGKWGSAPD